MRKFTISIAAILLMASISPTVFGKGITKTLLDLCRESELIVVAEVIRSTPLHEKSASEEGNAVLKINSIVKGEADSEIISCYYWTGMICPYPPNYSVGSTVLAFLNIRNNNNGYYTLGDHHGAKTLSYEGQDIFLTRTIEALDILGTTDRRESKIIEWLVRCAEDPVTRWDGVYELYRNIGISNQFPGSYVNYSKELTSDQIARLYKIVLQTDYFASPEAWIINVIRDSVDERLASLLIKCLKGDVGYSTQFNSEMMTLITEIRDMPEGYRLVEEYNSLKSDDSWIENSKIIIDEFINKAEMAIR